MTDNELLLAISGLFDKKLKPIYDRLDRIDDRLEKVEARLEKLETRVDRIEITLEENVLPRLERIENTIEKEIRPRMKRMELTLENKMLPRIQTIEECYTSTYKRYQVGCEQIETMGADMQIIKQVMMEHSKKLQKIS